MEKPIETTDLENQTLSRIVEEYRLRFAEAVEKDSKAAREKAESESSGIIEEARLHAEQLVEQTVAEARRESFDLMAKSRQMANEIAGEVESYASALEELRSSIDRETASILDKVHHCVDLLRRVAEEGDKDTDGSENGAGNTIEKTDEVADESYRALARQKTKKESEGRRQSSPTKVSEVQDSRETREPALPHKKPAVGKDEHRQPELLTGTFEMGVTPSAATDALGTMLDKLSKIKHLQVMWHPASRSQPAGATVVIRRPMPLLRILREMPCVKEAVSTDNRIDVTLDTSFEWVG